MCDTSLNKLSHRKELDLPWTLTTFVNCSLHLPSRDAWAHLHMWTSVWKLPQPECWCGSRASCESEGFGGESWDPEMIQHLVFMLCNQQACLVISPESHFPASTCPSTGVRMRHTRKAETQRNHLTRPDMCPTVELCSRAEARESTSCSAIGMKIADNQHRVIADVCGVRLRK